jgi:5-methylcytosine-specific restriction endonuclease McrA
MNSKNGKWAKKYDSCVGCGTNHHRYMGRGLCNLCYLKEYREDPANIPRIRQAKRRFYVTKITPELTKITRERKHFDGKREEVLSRDNYRCVICESKTNLVVHHKDGSGRGERDSHNNDVANLETLCRACHMETHRKDLMLAKKNSKQ